VDGAGAASSRRRLRPHVAGPVLEERYSPPVDTERARSLLAAERERIERAIAELGRPGSNEGGDNDSETLYQNEFDATQAEDLVPQLEAVERAEARLAAGTYGLSVESGEPIPDERLEALPTAERTVAEEERRGS
jgi:DnaK suppressor protein